MFKYNIEITLHYRKQEQEILKLTPSAVLVGYHQRF